MARPISLIYQQLLTAKQAQSNLSNLNSLSQLSTWNLWLYITAVGQSLFEQLSDIFQTQMETIAIQAPVYSAQWIQKMLFYFQYSASSPQFIQIIVASIYPYVTMAYSIVDATLNIITQAAVQPTNNRTVLIKVASSSAPLTSLQLAALNSYLISIMPPGTQWSVLSVAADQVFCQTTVYYNAAYSGVILANLQAAYNAFLAAIPFNGTFEVSDLLEALKSVQGVSDVVIQNIQVRQYNQSFGFGTDLVKTNKLLLRNWATFAGYAIDETTVGETFSNQCTLVAN